MAKQFTKLCYDVQKPQTFIGTNYESLSLASKFCITFEKSNE